MFGSAKDVLSLNTHSAQPSASPKAFNNYFCYQDRLKNVFSFPTKTSNVYIFFFRAWNLVSGSTTEFLNNLADLDAGL